MAYVEPSVRPDDGRYGENLNRFQLHTQFQVILKPDPGNPQEFHLEALKALDVAPQNKIILSNFPSNSTTASMFKMLRTMNESPTWRFVIFTATALDQLA